MTDPIVRDADGSWRWDHPDIDLSGTYDSPVEVVEAGIEALREAVRAGRLEADRAREIAADTRFALGAQEHHLGGSDASAFEALSAFEDELGEG